MCVSLISAMLFSIRKPTSQMDFYKKEKINFSRNNLGLILLPQKMIFTGAAGRKAATTTLHSTYHGLIILHVIHKKGFICSTLWQGCL